MIRTTAFLLFGVCFAATSTPAFASLIDGAQLESVTVDIVGSVAGTDQRQATSIPALIDVETADFSATRDVVGSAGQLWRVDDLSISGNADPFIDLDFSVTNVSTSPVDIFVSAVVPIVGSFPGPNVIFGRIEGTYSDTGGDPGVSLLPILGAPIFTGTVDGGDALPITVVTIASPTPGVTINFGPTTDTNPSFGAATSTIGIDIEFTLSPGDTATIDSFFSLEPIPEPTTVVLLAIGVTAAATARRRS